jgi:hypothetical protein
VRQPPGRGPAWDIGTCEGIGAPAPIIARELPGDTANPNLLAVTVYLAIASALTVIAVLAAKETARSSRDK